jgi:hypothetical protein
MEGEEKRKEKRTKTQGNMMAEVKHSPSSGASQHIF